MNLNEILNEISKHNELKLNRDESEKLDIYLDGLIRIIKILDKEGK